MSRIFKLAFILFPFTLLFTFLISPTFLFAADPPEDPFYTEGRPLVSVPAPGTVDESVDPFSGNLTLVHTDIHLPGNGGLDLNIMRTYSSAIWGRRDVTGPGLVAWNRNSTLGIGWRMHMGIVINPWGSGSDNRYLPDNPVVEMPDGSRHVLFQDKNDFTRFISKDYWIYKDLGDGTWELTLTDGTKYTFEWNANAGYNDRSGVNIAQATAIEHPNGNSRIDIYYDKRTDYSYLDEIQDSVGRTVSFTYNYTDHTLTRVQAAGIDYRYYYTTIDGMKFLREVEPQTKPIPKV